MGKGTAVPSPQTPSSSGKFSRRLWRTLLEATADAGVGVRRVVAANAERPEILVLAIVTAMAQARVTTAEIPVIRDISGCATGCGARIQSPFQTALCWEGEVIFFLGGGI